MPIGFNMDSKSATGESSTKKKVQQTAKKETNAANEKPDTKGVANSDADDFDDDSDFDIQGGKKKDKKLIYVAIAVIVILAVAIVYSLMSRKGEQPEVSTDIVDTQMSNDYVDYDEEDPYIYDEDGNPVYSKEDNSVVNDDAIDPGAADYADSDKNTPPSQVYDPNDTLKDINGVDINATYNVVSRDYLYDYVSYTAKRGIIDDGMEIYWLEADYHGKKYRIQCPFYYFKDFSSTGVCRVQIEVLNIEGGGKVISYMQVVSNPEEDQQ